MLAITQHGAEAHFVRPDGVMRSSIIRAIPGFQPVENAQGVALRFTQPHYFATTLSGAGLGGIPLWQRVRLAIQSAIARKQAVAVMRRAAAVNGLGGYGFRGSDVPYEIATALPSVSGPGRYGFINANEQMAHIAMRITAGIAPDGLVPGVAQTQMQAAAAVAPNYAAEPARLASMVDNYVTGDVANAAYARAMNFFNRIRMWWFG